MSDSTVEIHFVNAALHGMRRHGRDVAAVLAQAGISPQWLDEPRARVSFEQFSRLVQAIWVHLDDELSGFGTAPIRYGSFALMCESMLRRRTLREAMQRMVQVYRIVQSNRLLDLRHEADRSLLIVDACDLDDPQHFIVESLLMIWHRLASWVIGRRITLDEVRLAYAAPRHAAAYGLLFDAPQRFDSDCNALVIASRYMDKPVQQDEHSLRSFLQATPMPLLKRPDRGHTVAARVRLLWAKRGSELGLDEVARELAMSAMTLRRRLHDEGESFQHLKDQWRRDLAIRLLAHGKAPLEEVAERTGFSEPSALVRAFKKWTGLTPAAYRSSALRQIVQ